MNNRPTIQAVLAAALLLAGLVLLPFLRALALLLLGGAAVLGYLALKAR